MSQLSRSGELILTQASNAAEGKTILDRGIDVRPQFLLDNLGGGAPCRTQNSPRLHAEEQSHRNSDTHLLVASGHPCYEDVGLIEARTMWHPDLRTVDEVVLSWS
jgi:hypothetical protein